MIFGNKFTFTFFDVILWITMIVTIIGLVYVFYNYDEFNKPIEEEPKQTIYNIVIVNNYDNTSCTQ